MKVMWIIVMLSASALGQSSSGILAPARATDWTYAGIPGGIPTRATVCANVLTTDNTSQIQTKITNCSQDQVVLFPAGTWTLTGSLTSYKGIVLRGAGPTQTTINLNGNQITLTKDPSGGTGGYPGPLTASNWTGGLSKGSTVLTLASTTGLAANQGIVLDQHNAAWVLPDTGVEGPCTSGNSCGRNDSPLQFWGASSRAQPEMVEIQSVDSLTQITIKAPGVAYDHSSGLAPQAMWWPGGNVKNAGVESMRLNAASSDQTALNMLFCDQCWVKNVEINHCGRTAVLFWWSLRDEVRDSYFSSTLGSGSTEYGIDPRAASFTKIENNIFFNITSPIMIETSYGTVAGYNYIDNQNAGAVFGNIDTHLSHNYLQLYEGNVIQMLNWDNSWGSASQNTAFRNRMLGNGPNKNSYREPMKVDASNRYMNMIGNVLGDPAIHTRYRCDNVDTSDVDNHVYAIGFFNDCVNGTSGYDTIAKTSLMRWGNWDVFTNATRWCGNSSDTGWSTTCASTSEVPTGDANFPNPVPATETLPASFYLASKPAWFGSVIWPAIGPDVSCSTNCIANTGTHAAMIPAQLCYNNTAKDGSGYLTAFDGGVCYASAPASPLPPTGLKVTSN